MGYAIKLENKLIYFDENEISNIIKHTFVVEDLDA